jgi:hypothetical protein
MRPSQCQTIHRLESTLHRIQDTTAHRDTTRKDTPRTLLNTRTTLSGTPSIHQSRLLAATQQNNESDPVDRAEMSPSDNEWLVSLGPSYLAFSMLPPVSSFWELSFAECVLVITQGLPDLALCSLTVVHESSRLHMGRCNGTFTLIPPPSKITVMASILTTLNESCTEIDQSAHGLPPRNSLSRCLFDYPRIGMIRLPKALYISSHFSLHCGVR